MTRYVVVTPIRDEEKFIEATITSVQAQTIQPSQWVIVDDGSTDRTGEIIDHYAAQLPWIRVIHRCWLDGIPYDPALHGAAATLAKQTTEQTAA